MPIQYEGQALYIVGSPLISGTGHRLTREEGVAFNQVMADGLRFAALNNMPVIWEHISQYDPSQKTLEKFVAEAFRDRPELGKRLWEKQIIWSTMVTGTSAEAAGRFRAELARKGIRPTRFIAAGVFAEQGVKKGLTCLREAFPHSELILMGGAGSPFHAEFPEEVRVRFLKEMEALGVKHTEVTHGQTEGKKGAPIFDFRRIGEGKHDALKPPRHYLS